jgi:hypothetical protein
MVGLLSDPVMAVGNDLPPTVPPIYVPGARVVDIRESDGSLHRYTTIPTTSLFRTHGSSECTFTAAGSGTTSDGTAYVAGQVVYSERWMFVEGLPEGFGEPNPADPTAGLGALADAVRHFIVFCDSYQHPLGLLDVGSRDPMLDPRQQLTVLRNDVQLVAPTVVDDPIVAEWGGWVTRHPGWLAVQPPAWRPQASNAVTWRGWTMYLLVTPRSLDFLVEYTPSAESAAMGITGWTEVVACVAPGDAVVAAPARVPARPDLGSPRPPGVNGPCTVTAPGAGTFTVTPIEAYDVVFWANGYTERLDPYWWAGPSSSFAVGDLASVNVTG